MNSSRVGDGSIDAANETLQVASDWTAPGVESLAGVTPLRDYGSSDAARVSQPQLKVLFITGYAQNAAVENGLLGPGMHVLTKPFDLGVLASKARAIIGR